ncbi:MULTISPECIES: hypothetical protein [Pacificimonas]|nr:MULTISPECIES: hypothetical protein [Pacificimonas]MBZ6378717.1 hypothetical protein [Pacificimonas aurantium]
MADAITGMDEDLDAPMADDAVSPPDTRVPDNDDTPERPRGRLVIFVAAFLSLLWLGICAAAIWQLARGTSLDLIALTEWAAIAAGLFSPIVAIWLCALVILRVDPGRSRRSLAEIEAAEKRFDLAADQIAARLSHVDRLLISTSERVDETGARLGSFGNEFEGMTGRALETGRTLSAALSEDRERIESSISHLADRTDAARTQVADMENMLPQLAEMSDTVGSALADHTETATERLGNLRRIVQDLEVIEQRAAEAAIGRGRNCEEMLAHIDRAVRDVEGLLEERRSDLLGASDEALQRVADTFDRVRQDLREETGRTLSEASETVEGLRGTIRDEGHRLREIGEEAGSRVGGEARRAADEARASLDALSERVEAFAADLAAQDERLRSSLGSANETIGTASERLADIERRSSALGEPLEQLAARGETLRIELGDTATHVDRLTEDLTNSLAPAAAERRSELEDVRSSIAAIGQEIESLGVRTKEISEPARAIREDIENGVRALDASAERMSGASETLRRELAEAESLLGAVKLQSEDTALEASGKLIEALSRVREVADQAAKSVRETLDGVVGDAVNALEAASSDAVSKAVGGPVEGEIERLEGVAERSASAAQAAAERLSRSLVSVAETAAAVETRVAEANDHFEAAQKRDLAEQSNLLMEALNSHAIDITKAMSADVTEQAWTSYLAGDRSVFTRRASRLLESGDMKRIAKMYEEEPEFREAVRHYLADYEAMLRRVMQDRQGNALSVALVSSDVGRLYVALAQATDRLRKE